MTLASVTTHDLPTVAGFWSGQDVPTQRQFGPCPPVKDFKRICRRLRIAGLEQNTNLNEVMIRIHQLRAEGSSILRVATLDDGLQVQERPNMPGTVTEYPNWSLALPQPLETICRHPLVRKVAEAMGNPIKHKRQIK